MLRRMSLGARCAWLQWTSMITMWVVAFLGGRWLVTTVEPWWLALLLCFAVGLGIGWGWLRLYKWALDRVFMGWIMEQPPEQRYLLLLHYRFNVKEE